MVFPKVCAITLSYNRKDCTLECIESLKRLTYPNYEILVVENGSNDGSKEEIRNRYPEINVVDLDENIGYSRGLNIGLDFASRREAAYFLILNNDTVIDALALLEMVKTAQEDERIGFVSGKVYHYNDPLRLQTAGRTSHPYFLIGEHVGSDEYDRGQYDEVKEFDFVDDVFLLVKREVYESVGGYDATFFLYWEETDWCARVRRAGYKIVYTPMAKIWHKGGLSVSTGISKESLFYLVRNQFPFIWRNGNPVQIRKVFANLFFYEYPRRIARLVKHGKYSYVGAYIGGILSGLGWVTKEVLSPAKADSFRTRGNPKEARLKRRGAKPASSRSG